MRKISHITATPFSVVAPRWREAMASAGLVAQEESARGGDAVRFTIEVDQSQPAYGAFMQWVRESGFAVFERVEVAWTPQELREAAWVTPRIGGAPLRAAQTDHAGWDFDHACPQCGAGATRATPLVVPKSKVPRYGLFRTTEWGEMVVRRELVEGGGALANCLGRFLLPVLDPSGSQTEWLVVTTRAMRTIRLDAERSGLVREGGCDACGRDGWFDGTNAFTPAVAPQDSGSLGEEQAVACWQVMGCCSRERGVFTPQLLLRNDGGRVAECFADERDVDVIPVAARAP